MVDIGHKASSLRSATAEALVRLPRDVFETLKKTHGELAKGNVLSTARLAGIMGAKHTSTIIPLAHPLLFSHCAVDMELDEDSGTVVVTSTVKCSGNTGVEMEAMVSASTAALTLYDMCKGVSKAIVLEQVRLIRKTGGKSGTWQAPQRGSHLQP